jgi:hypothetical protein
VCSVQVILTHTILCGPPVDNRAALVDVLSKHKGLWDRERMMALLTKEDLFELCNTISS